MKKYLKKIIIFLTIIILLFTVTGCWDRREPEDLGVVVGLGFDYNPDNDMYKLIIQIASPLVAQGMEAGGGEGKEDFWTVSAWGHTTIDALSNIRKKVSRFIHYSHTQIFVISEEFVRETGILPVLDALERTRESRPIVLITVVKDDPEEVLTTDNPIETINAKGITEMIKLTNEEIGSVIAETGNDFINKLSRPGLEPVAVKLELVNKNENGQENENSQNEQTEMHGQSPPYKVEGLAFFKKDKLAGFLEGRETRGWNWVRGNIQRAILNLESPEEDEPVSMVAYQTKRKWEPLIKNGEPVVKLQIDATAKIQGIMGRGEFDEEKEFVKSLKRRFTQVIRNDIEIALSAAQEKKSDIFGFGNLFYRYENKYWEQELKDDWPEKFSEMVVEIDIEVDIVRTGMIYRSVKPR